jgi:hypothetical protein
MAKKIEIPEQEVVEVDANDGNRYSLPYGIAKGLGLDTTGMRPREVWDMLKNRGITPKDAYAKLKEKAQNELPEKPIEVKEVSKYQTKADVENWGARNNVDFSKAFNGLSEDKAVEQSRRVIELYEEFPVEPKSGNTVYVSCENWGGRSVASAQYSFVQDRVGIVFNKDNFNSTDEKEVERDVKAGWRSETSPENYKYQTVNHEYGHAIEYACLSRLGFKEYVDERKAELLEKARYDWNVARKFKSESKKMVDNARKELFYDKVFPEIFKRAQQEDRSLKIPKTITKNGHKTAPKVSEYGASSWAEYFAESFANGVGGAPNAIGKATVSVVKDIYGGKFL